MHKTFYYKCLFVIPIATKCRVSELYPIYLLLVPNNIVVTCSYNYTLEYIDYIALYVHVHVLFVNTLNNPTLHDELSAHIAKSLKFMSQ